MCSRPFRPVGLPIYVARLPRLHSLVATLATLPSISEISFFDCSFAIISSKIGCRMDSVQFARVLVWLNHFVIATELVTTRAMPDRDVFYVAHPVRSILRKHGYPPDLQDEATKLVLAQAELLCAEWAA